MYKKLLLSNDGGIIDAIHLCEGDNAAFINIGLGGTGIDCLIKLKKKVYNNIVPDDTESGNSVYNHIKFLAVDGDINESFKKLCNNEMPKEELFDISFDGFLGKKIGYAKEYREWLRDREIGVSAEQAGACGVRQIGRFLLFQKTKEFVDKIQFLVKEAKSGFIHPRVYIHIFSGLGGGTGSGTFLDVCYLVRKALESESANALVSGYFFLPDVNLSRRVPKETESYIKVNGYASLQELDYCMNFDRNGDKWSQVYPNIGLIETNRQPVDLCYLISSHNVDGEILTNGYEYALNTVAEYVLNYVIKASEYGTLLSDWCNLNWHLAHVNKSAGANYEYISIGNSIARIPYKEVLTYLSSYLFGYMAKMNINTAGNSDCDVFVKANGLGYDSLFNMVMNGVDISFPEPDNRPRDAYENDNLVTAYFVNLRSNAVGVAKRNINQMKREIDIYDTANAGGNSGHERGNSHACSIITKIFNALNNIVVDPEKGPYFASSLINGTSGNDLLAYVDGHIEHINSRISQLEFNLPKFEHRREMSQTEFLYGRPLILTRRYREYVAASKELIRQYTQQEIFYAFRDFLYTLRKQMIELSTKYYRVYSTVITNLNETFIANKKYLEIIADNVETYEYPIATIKDLKETLDSYLRGNFDVPSQMQVFHQYMLTADGYKAWKDYQEDDICKFISEYFLSVFNEFTNKSMTQYFQELYGTNHPKILANNIRKGVMRALDDNAKPLFWVSGLYNVGNGLKNGRITFPECCQEVSIAADDLRQTKTELLARPSNVKDKITITRCFIGLPLYAYQPLSEYEDRAISYCMTGTHLYEGKEYIDENGNVKKGRDWRCLPSPIPFSLMNEESPSMIFESAQHRKKLYDLAEEMNIIHHSYGEYTVKIIDDEFMQEIERMANKVIKSNDMAKSEEVCQCIKEMKNSIVYSDITYEIPNDAHDYNGCVSEENKRVVRIDHFVKSPIICVAVEKEIAKLNRIDELIVSLEPK